MKNKTCYHYAMKKDSGNTAFFAALTVSLVLIAIIAYVWITVSIPSEYLQDSLLISIIFCVALITVGVYQSLRLYENAQTIAEEMTRDMMVNSKELFFELYQRSPVSYITVDEHAIIESVNYAMARFFNMEMNACVGLNVFDLLIEEETTKLDLAPEYFVQGKFLSDVEVCLRRPDGGIRWVMFSLYSFKDGAHKKKGLVTLVDVTKQKQIDKAKSEFVSLASHQLRTPIASMRWNVELLETAGKDSMNSTQLSYIGKIGHGLSRMDMLVNDFLNVSKFELGTLVAKNEPLEILEFLETIQEEQKSFAEKKGLRMEVDWDKNIGIVHTDSHLLHMILNNLLSNAIKYTPEGGVVRNVVISDGASYIVRISDSGIGIPKAEQDMIFSKVFRASNTESLAVEGTGLGLYIVKEAVHVLGGTISFESVEGEGTTFTVVLPK